LKKDNRKATHRVAFVIVDQFGNFARCANIFARSDRERAPIALLAKCEPESKTHCVLGGKMGGWVTKK
jgi:hypothetical protein